MTERGGVINLHKIVLSNLWMAPMSLGLNLVAGTSMSLGLNVVAGTSMSEYSMSGTSMSGTSKS